MPNTQILFLYPIHIAMCEDIFCYDFSVNKFKFSIFYFVEMRPVTWSIEFFAQPRRQLVVW